MKVITQAVQYKEFSDKRTLKMISEIYINSSKEQGTLDIEHFDWMVLYLPIGQPRQLDAAMASSNYEQTNLFVHKAHKYCF